MTSGSPMDTTSSEVVAVSFIADAPWHPSPFLLRRGRNLMLKEMSSANNLTIARFATLAGKTRGQVHREIRAGKLLALDAPGRRQVVPAWLLDPVRRKLTTSLLRQAREIDPWTLFYALTDPNEALDGGMPIDIVTPRRVHKLVGLLCAQLGIQPT